jgi:hypothetical protein
MDSLFWHIYLIISFRDGVSISACTMGLIANANELKTNLIQKQELIA